ncbi:hypothetical protein [Streptomyces adelaidensis]|uniref:hypothetical protein n=1 Tax=Streptomyces adelaidensis TaxID=2796465 RepID=UPI00190641B8|nr:hypothetical protein [Streptomyces adelaidensis]
MQKLTGGQIAVLVVTTIPMVAVGVGGAIGTYANAASVLRRKETALGVVAAGEGATLVAALVMIVVTMLGQTAPRIVRAALWLLPAAASAMGLAIAPTFTEAVVFALTPLAMTAAAEGISFLARRIVVHRTGVDIEAQRRNATTLRQIAYHRARAERHPWKWVRKRSTLRVWRLLSQAGDGDAELGAGLVGVQRDRLTEGANLALADMLTGRPAHLELTAAQPVVSREPKPEPAEPTDFETTVHTALTVTSSEPHTVLVDPLIPPTAHLPTASDQVISREPVLSPAEPILMSRPEPSPEPDGEPEPDETKRQITELASRLRAGERLTKTTAAEILGVSPATAGRRLKDARGRVNEGTGFYA